ncbi:MAG: phosphopantetheine-binding protein [Cyanobacteria bacterium J06656_5]
MWSEILDIPSIGIHDNFFQLGGDSITAAQIINRVRVELRVELLLLIFFQQPTIANMAITITQMQAKTIDSDEMVQLLTELESLSDEDTQQLVK